MKYIKKVVCCELVHNGEHLLLTFVFICPTIQVKLYFMYSMG